MKLIYGYENGKLNSLIIAVALIVSTYSCWFCGTRHSLIKKLHCIFIPFKSPDSGFLEWKFYFGYGVDTFGMSFDFQNSIEATIYAVEWLHKLSNTFVSVWEKNFNQKHFSYLTRKFPTCLHTSVCYLSRDMRRKIESRKLSTKCVVEIHAGNIQFPFSLRL